MSNSPETKITVLEHQMKEIKEEVTELRRETKEGFNKITDKLDCYVTKVQYESDLHNIREKLGRSSGNWDWIIKTVMGIVIGALLTKLLVG